MNKCLPLKPIYSALIQCLLSLKMSIKHYCVSSRNCYPGSIKLRYFKSLTKYKAHRVPSKIEVKCRVVGRPPTLHVKQIAEDYTLKLD